MNSYVVYQNFLGVKFYHVYAESAAEARRKVDAGDSEDVEGLDFYVVRFSKAGVARLEEKDVQRGK